MSKTTENPTGTNVVKMSVDNRECNHPLIGPDLRALCPGMCGLCYTTTSTISTTIRTITSTTTRTSTTTMTTRIFTTKRPLTWCEDDPICSTLEGLCNCETVGEMVR